MPIVRSRRHFRPNSVSPVLAGLGGTGPDRLPQNRRRKSRRSALRRTPAPALRRRRPRKLLRAEGFTDIRYVDLTEAHVRRAAATGANFVVDMIDHDEVDFGRAFAPGLVIGMGAGAPVTVLAGLHTGCFEVLRERVTSAASRT